MEVQGTPLLGWIVGQAGLTDDQAKLVIQKLALLSVGAVESLQVAAAAAGVRSIENIVERCSENALLALNNVVSEDNALHNLYLVEKGILPLILPCAHSQSFPLRILSLKIIGNLGVKNEPDGFKSSVLATQAVASIAQSYSSIDQLTGIAHDRYARYAQTINQLANSRTAQQFRVLKAFVPILWDIIRNKESLESVQYACEAVEHLLDAHDPETVNYLMGEEIMFVLVLCLSDAQMAPCALKTLTMFAQCSNSKQVVELEPVLRDLEQYIVGDNHLMSLQAMDCLVHICEKRSDRSIQQILLHAPQLLQRLMHIAQSVKTGLSAVRATSEGAALALALAVQGANVVQLEYFVSLKMYPFLFELLDIFQYNLRVVKEAIKALTAMVLKVGNIRDVQQRAISRYCIDVSDGWFRLFNWASTSTNDDKLSAVEREDWQEIVGALNNLLLHARNLDLLPHGLPKVSVSDVAGSL
eukprot:gene15366-17580_t